VPVDRERVPPVERDDRVRPLLLDRERVDAARCDRWPSSPCCFMTVRAATSFARLP
jgi:hypothetical protein